MIIDCDTHAMLPDAFDYLAPGLASLAPRLAFNPNDGSYDVVEFRGRPGTVPGSFPQARTGNKLRGAAFLEDRIEDFERLHVDRQLLMSNFTGWWSYLIEPELGAAMAHSHNVSMLGAMQRYPDQFLGIALVALQNVEASIAEIEWAKANGFSAAVLDHAYPVRQHPFGTSLGEHLELWPFFEKAQDIEMPLFIHNVLHGHSVQNLPRLLPLGLDELSRTDAQVNMVSLIFSGLLDDFPQLQFVIAEQGTGWIKPLAQLLDARFERKPRDFASENDARTSAPESTSVSRGGNASGLNVDATRVTTIQMRKATVPENLRTKKSKLAPSHYIRWNFFFTIETEEPELAEAIEFVGADRFLFATDYPHDDPGGLLKWRDVELLSANQHISETDKALIFSENAARLFKLS